MDVQVDDQNYSYDIYMSGQRWQSYYNQIVEVMNCHPKSVLVIGIGDGIVVDVLKKYLSKEKVKTLDFADYLQPDFCGNVDEVEKIVGNNRFDCIICCQVLEHIQFIYFDEILRQFEKILNDNGTLIMSLPQGHKTYKVQLDLPKFHHKFFLTTDMICRRKNYKFNGQHYWEVGYKGYGKKLIVKLLKKYFEITRTYILFENPYHWFAVVYKRKQS